MKNNFFKIYCQRFLSIFVLLNGLSIFSLPAPQPRAVIFCLHDINGKGKYSLSVRQLEELLYLLKQERYPVMSLRDWRYLLNTGELSQPAVILTFDDGYPSLLTAVVPRLQQYNFGATFYIYTERYSPNSSFFRQLAQLPPQFEIGSHTFNHTQMTVIGAEQFFQELYHSRLKLAFLTQREIESFAWPYGAYKPEFIELAFQAGYKTQVSVEHRMARAEDLSRILPRYTLTQPNSLGVARKALMALK